MEIFGYGRKPDLYSVFDWVLKDAGIENCTIDQVRSLFNDESGPDKRMNKFMSNILNDLCTVGCNFITEQFPDGPINDALQEFFLSTTRNENYQEYRNSTMMFAIMEDREEAMDGAPEEAMDFIRTSGVEGSSVELIYGSSVEPTSPFQEDSPRIIEESFFLVSYYHAIDRVKQPLRFLMDILAAAVMNQDIQRGIFSKKGPEWTDMRIEEYNRYFVEHMIRKFPQILDDDDLAQDIVRYCIIQAPKSGEDLFNLAYPGEFSTDEIKPIPDHLAYPRLSSIGARIKAPTDSETHGVHYLN